MNMICDEVFDLAPAFVLGALDATQMAVIRERLAECPEAHAEIAELGGVVAYLNAGLDPVEPPASLRASILEAAARVQPAVAGSPAAAPAVPAPAPPEALIPFPGAEERDRRAHARRDRVGRWGMGIAAVLALAVLGGWNLELQSHLSSVQADLTAAHAYQGAVAAVLDVGTRSGAQTAFLAAAKPDLKSTGLAAAAPDGTVAMALRDLVPTAGSQVYEAWVIVGHSAPVALGGFTVAADGTGILQATTSVAKPGATIALTLEPAPGATTPGGPVVSAGSLVAPAS